ncbi:MAG TPA: hypothetical protein VE870_11470 [Bacteroidales bacterium]|nr:hypothetical protein [Bacteroidales bacterium]
MRIAILDFGTNTFNLLIAETSDEQKLRIIHSSKEPARLGQGGINNGTITPEAFQRGLTAIEKHFEKIKIFEAEKVYAYATSAIREAKNGKEFSREVDRRFGLYVNIIPGEREAELIYKGVRQSLTLTQKKVLILDIGGGSNEFIIADHNAIYWKYSFDLGMARLLDMFTPSDPVTEDEVLNIEAFLEQKMGPLFDAIREYHPTELVGASGSFETFFALLAYQIPARYKLNGSHAHDISIDDYTLLHERLLRSTTNDRSKMEGMEPVRIDMIVLATIFVNFTIRKCGIHKIIQSDFALKEGVIAEILNI